MTVQISVTRLSWRNRRQIAKALSSMPNVYSSLFGMRFCSLVQKTGRNVKQLQVVSSTKKIWPSIYQVGQEARIAKMEYAISTSVAFMLPHRCCPFFNICRQPTMI
ncbi:hypothetical protein YC2023_050099 [Brassica napus]|uniref:(rape) hypothetical protein n=1 Tax=Brassica napus TaxID=3708 RepID=A0A816J897_BRANA|nr:unnamed protein product [Brassica napus]